MSIKKVSIIYFYVCHLYSISLIHYTIEDVYSSAPKLVWSDFVQVLKVFMSGQNQEHESDIERAFGILDQQKRGVLGRLVNRGDGLISPDELRAFLSILTDEVIFNLIQEEGLCSPLIIVSFSIVLIFVSSWLTQTTQAKLTSRNSLEWSSRVWQEISSVDACNGLNTTIIQWTYSNRIFLEGF